MTNTDTDSTAYVQPLLWWPGCPCRECGSTYTTLDDDDIPLCLDCHASDADER